MGDLFRKNWKKMTGVRAEDTPLSQDELARLKDIVAGSGSGGGPVALGGDLSGTSDAAVVGALQGEAVNAGAPASGQVLTHDGVEWAAATPAAASLVAEEFRVTIPAGASLAAKIAGATLPVGWSIVLANDGSVDAEIVATANDIVLIHTETRFAVGLNLVELDSTAAPLGGYYVINASAVPSLSKSNKLGTQFSVLGFAGLITLTRAQSIFVKMLPTP